MADAAWVARYRNLTPEQQNDFNIVMTMMDYSLHRANRGNCLDSRGRLRAEIAESRDAAADRLMGELEAGASLRATFPDRLPQRMRTRGGPVGSAITELPEFDFTTPEYASLGFGDDNDLCDECLINLWHEANEQMTPPVPPYASVDQNGRTFAHTQKMVLDSSDLRTAPFYVSDTAYTRYANEQKFYVKTLEEPDLAYLYSYGSKYFESYMANKVVMRTNEWLKDHDTQLTISQAQALREHIRVDPSYENTPYRNLEEAYEQMFDHIDANGQPVGGHVEEFLRERGLMPKLDDGAETLEQAVSSDSRMALFPPDEEPNGGLMGEYELIRRNGLTPVDVFGTEYSARIQGKSVNGRVTSHAMRQQVALYNDVHMYLTGDTEAQLMAAGIDPSDYESVRSAATFNLNASNVLAAKGAGAMYRITDGELVALDGRRQQLNPNASAQVALDETMAVGRYLTELDRAGVSQLRRHLKSADAATLNINVEQLSDNHRQMLLRSVENADAVISYMRDNGIEFELEQDERPNQLRARLANGLQVRLLDIEHPEMVGRVYGDGMQTVVQPQMQNIPAANIAANRGVLFESPTDPNRAVYMPSREEAVSALCMRLGRPSPMPLNPVHQVGARMKLVGPNGEVYRSGTELMNASYKSNSNSMQAVGVLTRIQGPAARGRAARTPSDVAVMLSTTRVGAPRITVPSGEKSLEELERLAIEAKVNFQNQVFGSGLSEQMVNTVPEYKKDQWVSYRRDPSQPDGYARDENGEKIVWRTSRRNQELMENAGRARDLESVEVSDDPNVRVLQEAYLVYLGTDDAILQGIVDGKAVDETQAEYNARVQASIAEHAMNVELEDESDAVKALMSSMDGLFGVQDETYTQQEKFEHVQEHFEHYSGNMFYQKYVVSTDADGNETRREDDGSELSANERYVLEINTASMKKYAGAEDADICRLIQSARQAGEVRIIGADEKEIEHILERSVQFDPETARNITDPTDSSLSPYWQHISQSARDAIQASGATVDELLVDEQGVLKYTATRDTSATGTESIQVSGTVGQLFEPDERGVTLTKYAHGNNVAMITRYRGTVIPGEGSMESRTLAFDNTDAQTEAMQAIISKQMGSMVVDNLQDAVLTDPLDASAMNRLYRSEDGPRLSLDYMADLRAKGFTQEEAEAYVESLHNSVSYDSSFVEEASLLAEMNQEKAFFVDNLNNDRLSLAGRRIGDMGARERGYFDLYATAGARDQGRMGYLVEGAHVDPETHKIVKSEIEGDRCPLLKQDFCRNMDYNPFDRNQMVWSNLIHSHGVEPDAVTAHVSIGGWTMDDAYTISKDYAERHLIPTENPEDTKALDVSVIEKNLPREKVLDAEGNPVMGSDGKPQTRVVGPFLDEDGKFKQEFRGALYEVDPDSDVPVAEQLKARLVEQGIGLRPMKEGDKLCDFNGNKGVISLVVDPDIDPAKAKERQIEDVVELYKLNPDLEIVGAPYTAVSRFNGGTVRSMMENPRPLYLPDGRVIEGGIGSQPMIISDNTVDHKSHVYDDEAVAEGKGRKASSQLGWGLQALGCDELMQFCYGDNAPNMRAIREKMIVLGVDFNENYQLHMGYAPHTLENGEQEVRQHITIDTELINPELKLGKDGFAHNKTKAESRDAADDTIRQAMAHGGMLELPFPVTMASGVVTPQDPESGKYLLPVLPIEYRADKGYESDGSISSVNFNAYYRDIIREAAAWETEAKAQAMGTEALHVNPEKSKAAQAESARRAQAAYDTMAQGVISREFEGKYNVWKSKAMSHRLDNSATLVMTPDPRLDINQIALDARVAESMGIAEGDPFVFWRDPMLRDAGVCTMEAKFRHFDEAGRQDMGIHPAADKPFDADFDGDTGANVGLRKASYKTTVIMQCYDAIGTEHFERKFELARRAAALESPESQAALDKVRGIVDTKDLALEDMKKQAKAAFIEAAGWASKGGNGNRKWDEQRRIYEADNERLAAIHDKMAFEKRLYDKSQTPVELKTADEIKLGLNLGLDVASGAHALDEQKSTVFTDAKKACQEAILAGDHQEALRQANTAVHAATKASFGVDVMDYKDEHTVYGSWNHMVVDSKAKGKLAAMDTVSATLNAEVRYLYDDEGKPKAIDVENCHIHQGAMATPWTQPMPEGLTPEQANQWLSNRDFREENYSGSANCTCIKAEFTGLYGSHAQRMVAALRNVEDDKGRAAIAYGLQLTYGGTQANLQSKHDVVAAIERSEATEALAAIWRGQAIAPDEKGKWHPVIGEEGYPERLTKDQWIDTMSRFYNDKHGLNVEVHPDVVRYVGEALYTGPVDKKGNPTARQASGKNTSACTLDRLAYGGGFQELCKSANAGKNLFDSERTAQFRPEGPVAKPEMKVRTASAASKDVSMARSFSAEVSAEKKAERQAERQSQRVQENKTANRLQSIISEHPGISMDDAVKMAKAQSDAEKAAKQQQNQQTISQASDTAETVSDKVKQAVEAAKTAGNPDLK